MVSKNNLKLLQEKRSNKFYRYSIKRLNVGVASVAVAAGLLFMGNAAVVEAASNEEVSAPVAETVAQPSETAASESLEAAPSLDETPASTPQAEPAKAEEAPTAEKENEEAPTAEKAGAEEKPATPEADKESRAGYYAGEGASNEPKERLALYANADQIPGKNVNSEIENVEIKISNPNSRVGEGTVQPQASGSLRVDTSFNIGNGAKAGDYFDIQFSNNVNLNGVMKDAAVSFEPIYYKGAVLAEPVVLPQEQRRIRYVLTPTAELLDNVKANVSFPIFIDPKTVPQDGPQNIMVSVGDRSQSHVINVDYQGIGKNPNTGVSNEILVQNIDWKGNTFRVQGVANATNLTLQTGAYPLDADYQAINQHLNPGVPTIAITKKDAQSDAAFSPADEVHVYRIPRGQEVNQSLYYNPNTLQEVTNDLNIKRTTEGIFIELPNGTSDAYYYTVDTKVKPAANGETTVSAKSTLYANNSRFYWTFDITKETNKADGSGEVKEKYNIGDFVWEDANKNGIQDAGEAGIAGVKVTLRDARGEVLESTVTDAQGNYHFNQKAAGVYIVTFDAPQGYLPSPANQGTPGKNSRGSQVVVSLENGNDMTVDSGFYKDEKKADKKFTNFEMTTEEVAFEVQTRENNNLPKGVTVVVQGGVKGRDRVIYKHELVETTETGQDTIQVDGKNYKSYFTEVSRVRELEPQAEIREVGTKEEVAPKDGKSSFVKLEAGTNSEGRQGKWVTSYFDKNGDGQFGEDEVVSREFIADGKDGDSGKDGKSSYVHLVKGENEAGDQGQWIISYFDKNGDGKFTEDEIVSTEFVADGKDGKGPKAEVKDNGDGTHTVTITNPDGT
ncbi:SdrD B-like domain-containing protein, partial [Aerococcus sp. HMSC06H08]